MARELGWGQKMTHISCNHNCAACCYNAPTITSWDTTTSNIVHYYLTVSPKLPLLNVTTLSFWFSWGSPTPALPAFHRQLVSHTKSEQISLSAGQKSEARSFSYVASPSTSGLITPDHSYFLVQMIWFVKWERWGLSLLWRSRKWTGQKKTHKALRFLENEAKFIQVIELLKNIYFFTFMLFQ